MPVLYTKRQIHDALRELRIRPLEGRVNAEEAARILTWRAKAEQQIEHAYTPNNIRKHKGKLDPIHPIKIDGTTNDQTNLYRVERVFELNIKPQRTNKGRPKKEKVEA